MRRETLVEQVAAHLQEMIRAQHLKPGEVLPSEIALARVFGVSKPVVREAMKSLEGMAIVEMINGKGAVIKSLDNKLLCIFFDRALQLQAGSRLQIIEMRRGLEIQGAILAAKRRTKEELERIRDMMIEARKHQRDLEKHIEFDLQFHLAIAAATHNPLIQGVMEALWSSLRGPMREMMQRSMKGRELEAIRKLHEAIFAKIEKGDAEGAGRMMALHFDEAEKAFDTIGLMT